MKSVDWWLIAEIVNGIYCAGMGWSFFPVRKGYVMPQVMRRFFRIAAISLLIVATTEYVWHWAP